MRLSVLTLFSRGELSDVDRFLEEAMLQKNGNSTFAVQSFVNKSLAFLIGIG